MHSGPLSRLVRRCGGGTHQPTQRVWQSSRSEQRRARGRVASATSDPDAEELLLEVLQHPGVLIERMLGHELSSAMQFEVALAVTVCGERPGPLRQPDVMLAGRRPQRL